MAQIINQKVTDLEHEKVTPVYYLWKEWEPEEKGGRVRGTRRLGLLGG